MDKSQARNFKVSICKSFETLIGYITQMTLYWYAKRKENNVVAMNIDGRTQGLNMLQNLFCAATSRNANSRILCLFGGVLQPCLEILQFQYKDDHNFNSNGEQGQGW